MTPKIRNKIKQMMYRPAKKNPNVEYVVKRLKEANDTVNSTVGGMLGKRDRRIKKETKDDEDEEQATSRRLLFFVVYDKLNMRQMFFTNEI